MRKRFNSARAAMLLLLALLFPFWGTVGQLWADNVTASQARQQAQAFLSSRIAAGNGPRHAPGTTPQLTEKRVSGLYVFNVSDNGGFVIVSNDDVAVPILGYSDNGTIDPDNMPDNMRAWLQGYADEIAWAKEHGIKVDDSSIPRINRAPKAPIAPLLTTTWNQDAPYNNWTPYYGISNGQYVYSTSAQSGYQHCATGCVATAMAQVMNYHEYPTGETAAIPSYKWSNATTDDKNPVNLPGLGAITFIWDNMSDNYANDATGETATAVAKLMQYCGYSVKMNYGPESSSNSNKVEYALKTYFDYDNTTKCVERNDYSYANWINLLYHEVSNSRPVVYGGQSSGGGHEFVCDGYQGEDYFHINWGWGGQSDEYYKLSALNPYEQGIGGSSSNDGFNFWQDAVIGIQPNGAGGEVLVVPTQGNWNLTMSSITLNKTTALTGEPVEATLVITNNGTSDYDADIFIVADAIITGKTFYIPAGQTKTCKINFTINNAGEYDIAAASGDYYYISQDKTAPLEVVNGNPTTDNIDLNYSLTIDTQEEIDGNPGHYNFYGSVLSGNISVENPSSLIYDGAYDLSVIIVIGSYGKEIVNEAGRITIPAASTINYPFNFAVPPEYASLLEQAVFVVQICYRKNGAWTDWDLVGYYHPQPGIIKYLADGTTSTVKVTSPFVVDDNTLAVNLIGSGVTNITPNANPNTLYIYSGTVPTGLDGKNVINCSGGNYAAGTITLTDGKEFYSPVDFTATKIEFTYANDRWADGKNGWNTIMLPFDVTSVTADGEAIDWFHSGTNTGKNFWLKSFSSDGATTVGFDYAKEMKANTPYIVAFPGDKWGDKWDLSGKTIKFIGNGAINKSGTISSTTGNYYRFIGSTVQDNTKDIYCINATGNAFELKATGGSAPFRAYFKPGIFDRTVTRLAIVGDTTTSIENINENESGNKNYYDLQGRRVTQPQKGLYIVNGKKVIVK